MNCFRPRSPKTLPPSKTSSSESSEQENPQPKNVKHEALLSIPGCKVHLMNKGEALELTHGDFNLLRLSDDNVFLATIVKVGDDLRWPLTKDEPVLKLDALHYLFSLPMKDSDPLSYGVSFSGQNGVNLGLLDSFLQENSCFSSSSSTQNKDVNWKEFAPRIEEYNNVLTRAIAGGTGQIIKGIFKCSNAYANQVQKGGQTILSQASEGENGVTVRDSKSNKGDGAIEKSRVNQSLKQVRDLSKMTERLSKAMLDGVGLVTGSAMAPVVQSQAGKAILGTIPGQVFLVSLDAVNRVIDAAEVAEKQALSATSGAAKRMVAQRLGESAGEATEDVLATAGHCAGTAWNIFKIRKAINPASSVSSGVLKQRSNK